MMKMAKTYSSNRMRASIETSMTLDGMELMPEEVAVLKMIHSTKFE